MCFFDFGMEKVEGMTRWDWRYAVTLERIEPFFALAAKPVRTLEGAVLAAKIEV